MGFENQYANLYENILENIKPTHMYRLMILLWLLPTSIFFQEMKNL